MVQVLQLVAAVLAVAAVAVELANGCNVVGRVGRQHGVRPDLRATQPFIVGVAWAVSSQRMCMRPPIASATITSCLACASAAFFGSSDSPLG